MARVVAVGKCGNCGKTVVREGVCTHGVCACKGNPVLVPLTELALVLAPRHMKQIQRVSELSGVAVEQLVDALLKEMASAVMRGLTVERDRGST